MTPEPGERPAQTHPKAPQLMPKVAMPISLPNPFTQLPHRPLPPPLPPLRHPRHHHSRILPPKLIIQQKRRHIPQKIQILPVAAPRPLLVMRTLREELLRAELLRRFALQLGVPLENRVPDMFVKGLPGVAGLVGWVEWCSRRVKAEKGVERFCGTEAVALLDAVMDRACGYQPGLRLGF